MQIVTAKAGDSEKKDTYDATAARADSVSLFNARQVFLGNKVAVTMIEAMPDMVAVLNVQRQIIAANQRFFDILQVTDANDVVGLRAGEAVDCIFASISPGGCGTGICCQQCGAVAAITEALLTHDIVTRECRIQTHGAADGGALDLEVRASMFSLNDTDMIILAMRDISAEKRRHLLERIFFHDVINTASGINFAAQLLTGDGNDEKIETMCKDVVKRLSLQIVEEILAQQQLLEAEEGELCPVNKLIAINELTAQVIDTFGQWETTPARVQLGEIPAGSISTDFVLLRRMLNNLVKNALEALEDGGIVTISATVDADEITFAVQNPGVIPEAVQHQIFQRSFSTKSNTGRGIGTYSVRLFAERYLHGRVYFVSNDVVGTVFYICLPVKGVG